ncbi:MAG: hypothetical protein O3B31_13065 [Chloroflexi bacterium]|nr:hypothetical protein [Chloroflexota bacterium]MDA1004251.1 hypothetical protein [Chloroflexota bacterium]
MDLADLRDILIIVYGVLGILLFLILIGLAVAVFLIMGQIRRILTDVVTDSVRPTLDEVHKTVQNVRGASDFMVDRAVHPFIRVLAVGRGMKRGAGLLRGIRSRIRK